LAGNHWSADQGFFEIRDQLRVSSANSEAMKTRARGQIGILSLLAGKCMQVVKSSTVF